jgi:hypothetical protein
MTFRKDVDLDTSQVEDLRGRGRVGGRVGGRGLAVGGGGVGGLILLVLVVLMGGGAGSSGYGSLLGEAVGAGAGNQPASTTLASECRTGADANERDDCRLVGYVDSIQAWWTTWFTAAGRAYQPSKTRFFSGAVQTGCGSATSEVGPFYCPADQYVYIDLDFFNDLSARFGASAGPFAQAYVLSHEYGHHVQHLLGLLATGPGEAGATGQSVRTELQADCLAGVWAANAVDTGYLLPLTDSQIADALDAAAAVGDDRIQARYQGRVSPESWTHGSSAQRQRWFVTGFKSGDPASCDTSGQL